jgi:hypothetical protein
MKRIAVATLLAVGLFWPATARAQTTTTVMAGEFCAASRQGQTQTAGNGEQVTCTTGPDGRLRWEPTAQVATTVVTTQATTATTAAAAVQSNVQATTPTTAMPRTGAREDREAAWGFAVLLVGVLAVAWARPRVAAMVAGPRVIEQERVDEKWKLLGWSEPWREHLNRKR